MAGEVRGSPGTRPRDFWKGRVTICRRIPSRLDGGVFVYVDDGRTFGADSLLLADFARPARDGDPPGERERVCDLGTGCGIIPLSWYAAPVLPTPRRSRRWSSAGRGGARLPIGH